MHVVVLRYYKELRVQLEATKMMEELLLDQLDFLSTMIDEEKKLVIENRIKTIHTYFTKLKSKWKALYDMIDDKCYSTLTDTEKIVFIEKYMEGKTAREITEKHPSINTQTIYNICLKINKQLNSIKLY